MGTCDLVLSSLAQQVMLEIDHPHCAKMIGVAVQQRPWLMVLEFLHCKKHLT